MVGVMNTFFIFDWFTAIQKIRDVHSDNLENQTAPTCHNLYRQPAPYGEPKFVYTYNSDA